MAEYYNRVSQEKMEAECFEKGNIDSFMNFLSTECCEILIRVSCGAKSAIVKFPFGHTKTLFVLDGDYVVKGYEIPNTLPKPMHEFHVVSPNDFKDNYIQVK